MTVSPYTGYNTNCNRTGYAYTSQAGAFAPNGYGLHDMAGNEFEWGWGSYLPPPAPLPAGAAGTGFGDDVGAVKGRNGVGG